MVEPLTMKSFVDHCCSIAVHPVVEMAYHLPKKYLATQYKISCQLIHTPSFHNGSDQLKMLHSKLKKLPNNLQPTTTSTLTTCQIFMLGHTLQYKILSLNLETFIG